jgi:hypothetical protein
MKVYGVTLNQCHDIARSLGIRFEGEDVSNSRGARTSGKLRADGATNPYPRVSASPFQTRRMPHCVCWHGHRDFMRAVFAIEPGARITTGLRGSIDYQGSEDFEQKYQDTAWLNIGAPIAPVAMCEACSCPESGEGE